MRKMTEKSIQEAFAGESMAHMKYMIFADVAESEGKKNIARLFRAIAYAEKVHATNHARLLGYIGKTAENLRTGINGEHFEIDEMYPAYDAIAKLQGEKGAERAIHYAVEAEAIHEEMYKEARETAAKGEDMDDEEVYVCPVCGYTHRGKPPEKCPVCSVPSEKFEKF